MLQLHCFPKALQRKEYTHKANPLGFQEHSAVKARGRKAEGSRVFGFSRYLLLSAEDAGKKGPKEDRNIRTLRIFQTMVSGILLAMGLSTRM